MLEALYIYHFIIVSNHQQQYEAYSSLVQKDDFVWSIKSVPNGKQSHTYEQVMKQYLPYCSQNSMRTISLYAIKVQS